MGKRLPKAQRKLLSRLKRKHSYEDPFLTNDEGIKLLLRELEDLGLIECQWSQDWKKPVVFAWIPCDRCIRGVCLGDAAPGDEIVPLWSCQHCNRYENDLDAAAAVEKFAQVTDLAEPSEHFFGFEVRRLDAVKNSLAHHWEGRVRHERAS